MPSNSPIKLKSPSSRNTGRFLWLERNWKFSLRWCGCEALGMAVALLTITLTNEKDLTKSISCDERRGFITRREPLERWTLSVYQQWTVRRDCWIRGCALQGTCVPATGCRKRSKPCKIMKITEIYWISLSGRSTCIVFDARQRSFWPPNHDWRGPSFPPP